MKCKRCGEEIPENGKICEFCGAKLSDDENDYQVPEYGIPTQPYDPPFDTPQPVEPYTAPKTKSKLLWVLLAVIVVLVAALAAIVLQQRKNDEVLKRQRQEAIHRIDSLYEKNLNGFRINLNLISKSEMVVFTHMFNSLGALRSIENIEKDELFPETGRKACLEEKIKSFEQKLEKEKERVSDELDKCEKNKIPEGKYTCKLRLKLSMIDSILDQISSGSAVSVDISPFIKELKVLEEL